MIFEGFYIFMLWIHSIFRSVLTLNCMLLLCFYDVLFSSELWLNDFDSFFSSWSMHPDLFITNVFINTEDYQHGRKCIYQQLSGKSWEADSSIGQKSSCEEHAPHTVKCILGGIFCTISKCFCWKLGIVYSQIWTFWHFEIRVTVRFELREEN